MLLNITTLSFNLINMFFKKIKPSINNMIGHIYFYGNTDMILDLLDYIIC